MKLFKTLLAGTLLLAAPASYAQVNITVDAKDKGPKVSPTLYGIFFEDINHAADGGLYAELIRNRSLEDNAHTPEAWSSVNLGEGSSMLEVTAEDPMNDVHQRSLRVIVKKADKANMTGVSNTGFWGINTVKGTTYKLSFWAKSDKFYKGSFKARLRNKDEKTSSLGETEIKVELSPEWQKFTATIQATGSDPAAVFDLLADAQGVFQLDMVSLFPPTYKDRENGLRPDLAQMLADLHPKFMRFPGGCFVEGSQTPDDAFRWERTIGPLEHRVGHNNLWGYRTSDGMGYHEFLQLAEDIGAKPLYVCNVGIWHGGYTPLEDMQQWVDECLNALEYANGDVNTKYGAMRAKNGHPEPFNIEYLEIGNENYQADTKTNNSSSIEYPQRYRLIYDAVKAKYPKMQVVGNVEAWGTDTPSWRNEHPVQLLDEHYYRTPQWFANNFHHYDSYDRKGAKVYVGEYAVTSGCGKMGNLNAALGEAIYMMGMENNSDVVALCSYAPIFVNQNDVRWNPDMIRFNSSMSMGTPSYYVQQLMPAYIGTQVLNTEWTADLPEKDETQQKTPIARVGLGTWGTNATYKDAKYIVEGTEISLEDFSKWETTKGKWNVQGDEVTQTSNEDGAILLSPEKYQHKKYTFTVRAKKNSGNEGFLIVFGYEDGQNYNWLNVGGWGNSQTNVEHFYNGGGSKTGNDVALKVEEGRWYDIRIDVDGTKVTCQIDGKTIQEGYLKKDEMKGVYATTTIDTAKKEMYVKVVNSGYGPTQGTLNLKHARAIEASVVRLSSANGEDENTMENPKAIVPKEAKASVDEKGDKIHFDVPSYSLNIIKVKLK